MLDPVGFADHVETTRPGIDGVAVPGLLSELDAVIGENGVDPLKDGFQQMLEELPGRLSVSRCNELSDREFGRSVIAHREIKLTFNRPHLGNVDMEEPDEERLDSWPLGLSPSTSGRRELPCRCRHRFTADRVRCGLDGCKA